MNKKVCGLGLVLLVGCVFCSKSFADADYHKRNAFNVFTDWTATVGKGTDDKQRIIDQRVETRAKAREASAAKIAQENKAKEHVNVPVPEEQKAVVEDVKGAVEGVKTEVKGEQESAAQKLKEEREEINQSYDKHIADLRYQYKDQPDTLNEKIKESEESRKKRLDEFDGAAKKGSAE